MAKLDERIEVIRERYGLAATDFWELPQKKGTWVAKHSALEVAAVKASIRFDMPVILEAHGGEGVAAVCVQGEMEGRVEWSIGEASPKNNKNAYPWAMAEKRAKDRVILKLIGIHGLVYSEEEMAGSGVGSGGYQAPAEEREEMSNPTAKMHWKTIADAMFACTTLKQLQGVWQRNYAVYQVLPEDLQKELSIWKDELKDKLLSAADAPAVPPKFDHLEGAANG